MCRDGAEVTAILVPPLSVPRRISLTHVSQVFPRAFSGVIEREFSKTLNSGERTSSGLRIRRCIRCAENLPELFKSLAEGREMMRSVRGRRRG